VTKKQLKESANHYKKCYDQILNGLPLWRQAAIKEDVVSRKSSGVLTDFIRMVIQVAEREENATKLANKNKKNTNKKWCITA